MNLAGKPISNTRCKTSVSSALGRACPVHGPCEIQAHWSHHWLTRRGQPSCRVRRVLRGPSLGLDSPELRPELKLGAGGTHLAVLHSPKGTLPTTTSFTADGLVGGGQRRGHCLIPRPWIPSVEHFIALVASCCLATRRVQELGLDLAGLIAPRL